VYVVAQKHPQVGQVGHQMVSGGVVAMFPALARGKGQPQRGGQVAERWRGARAPRGADGIAQHEAVVVLAAGRQAAQFYMHAVAERWQGGGFAFLYDL